MNKHPQGYDDDNQQEDCYDQEQDYYDDQQIEYCEAPEQNYPDKNNFAEEEEQNYQDPPNGDYVEQEEDIYEPGPEEEYVQQPTASYSRQQQGIEVPNATQYTEEQVQYEQPQFQLHRNYHHTQHAMKNTQQPQHQHQSRQRFGVSNLNRQNSNYQHASLPPQEGRRFRCGKHHREYLNKICTHCECDNSPMFCDRCIYEDPVHAGEHNNHVMSIEEFIKNADSVFDGHRQFFNEVEVVDENLLKFVRDGEANIRKYMSYIRAQKRELDERLRTLVRVFSETWENKINEIKRTLDKQAETFFSNYDFISKKIQSFYDYSGFTVIAYETYFNEETLSTEAKNARNPYDLDRFIRNVKEQLTKVRNFNHYVQVESGLPKKVIEDEIKGEFLKYCKQVEQQSEAPPSLENFHPHTPTKDSVKHSAKNCLNFYESYNNLMRDIDRSVQSFTKNHANFVPIEDITKSGIFNILNEEEEEFLANNSQQQTKKGMQGKKRGSTATQIKEKNPLVVTLPSFDNDVAMQEEQEQQLAEKINPQSEAGNVIY